MTNVKWAFIIGFIFCELINIHLFGFPSRGQATTGPHADPPALRIGKAANGVRYF
jgi:hypothetical protein